MLGKFKGVRNDIGNLAKGVDKQTLLKQLKEQWRPHLKTLDIERETNKAWMRITRSGPFLIAFNRVGITKDDIKNVVTELVEENKNA